MALTEADETSTETDRTETALTDGGKRSEQTYPVKELLEDAAGL